MRRKNRMRIFLAQEKQAKTNGTDDASSVIAIADDYVGSAALTSEKHGCVLIYPHDGFDGGYELIVEEPSEEQKLVAIMAAIIRTQTGKDSEGAAVEFARNILQIVRK